MKERIYVRKCPLSGSGRSKEKCTCVMCVKDTGNKGGLIRRSSESTDLRGLLLSQYSKSTVRKVLHLAEINVPQNSAVFFAKSLWEEYYLHNLIENSEPYTWCHLSLMLLFLRLLVNCPCNS